MLAGVLVGSISSMIDYKRSTQRVGFVGYSVVVALIWTSRTKRVLGGRRETFLRWDQEVVQEKARLTEPCRCRCETLGAFALCR